MKIHLVLSISLFGLAACCLGAVGAERAAGNPGRSFDSDWRFLRADAAGAEAPGVR